MVVAPTTAVPISTGLAVALKVLPAPSLASSRCLARSKLTVDVEIFLDFGFDVGNLLDQRKFVDGLGVVGDGAVGIDGDGDRAHAEESEGDQTERENRRSQHGRGRSQAHGAEVVGDGHQQHHRQAEVVAGEIPATNPERIPSDAPPSSRRDDDFPHMPRFGRGEYFHQFRDHALRPACRRR